MKGSFQLQFLRFQRLQLVVFLLASSAVVRADDFATQCAGREAIERVYYAHRTGTKPPFEETLSRADLENLVRKDAAMERTLAKTYGVKITAEMLAEEVQRINATTRAPAILADIKAALGNDPDKFANAFAKRFLVERLLREKFDNDDALHAPQRRECEGVRNQMLSAKSNGAAVASLVQLFKQAGGAKVSEITWDLTPPPVEETKSPTAEELEIKKRFGPNAQVLPAGGASDRKLYFADLPGELQRVLRAQLRQNGDVSAVIEMPGGFLLYLVEETTPEKLSVAVLTIPKRSYDEWLASPSDPP